MGPVEICIYEEGALKVVRHYDLRIRLRRLWAEGFGRHCVVQWPSCKCWYNSVGESKFNGVLIFIFLFTLGLALINIIYFEQLFSYRRPSYGNQGIIQWAVFALAVLAAVVFANKALKITLSALPRREEVQTITGLVEKF